MSPLLRPVLAIGIRNLPGWTPAQAQLLIATEKSKALSQNLELSVHAILLSDPEEIILAGIMTRLVEREWEVVALGFGLRGEKELTGLFEKVVNLVIGGRKAVRLAFPVLPDGIVDAVGRVIGRET